MECTTHLEKLVRNLREELTIKNNLVDELIKNQNALLRQLDENEKMQDYVISTETVRAMLKISNINFMANE